MAARPLNTAWTIDGARSGAVGGPPDAGLPAWFAAEGVRVDQTFTAVTAGPTRGDTPPDRLAFAVDADPREATFVAIRHESGALSFHLPGADRSGVESGEVRFDVPIHWPPEAASRGIFTKAVTAVVLKVAETVKDRLLGAAMPRLAAELEAALWSRAGRVEGWHRVTRDTLAAGTLRPEAPAPGGRALLLLHGTFSHAAAAFSALAASDFFARVKPLYGDRIYAYNHFTVSRTPDDNARRLLEDLPAEGLEFDVITHSRGGLVLRTLVEPVTSLGPHGGRFRLGHAVLVASPNAGTPLANPQRFEETFGWFANLLELLPENPFTTAPAFIANGITWLASHVVGTLPGLQAMNAAAPTIAALQGPPAPPAAAYSALVSNYRPDANAWMRLVDLGLDAFFESANDLVVPTEGGWRVDTPPTGRVPGPRIGCFGPGGNIPASGVTHVGFFSQPATIEFLATALKGGSHALTALPPETTLPNAQVLRDGELTMRAPMRRRRSGQVIAVRVINGDLLYERAPLVLGHYQSTRLTGAERYVDGLVGGAMSRALDVGLYPMAPGTYQIFPGRRLPPADAWRQRLDAVIVAGLGAEGSLDAQRLAATVRTAAIGWVQQVSEEAWRTGETLPAAVPLAATLLGSGGLGVTPAQSAQMIVQGMLDANLALADLNARAGDRRRPLIGEVRLVELYLDRAMDAWRALRPGARHEDASYVVERPVERRDGALTRTVRAGYRGVDYDYVRVETRQTDDGAEVLAYTFDTKRARSEVTSQEAQVLTVRRLVQKASSSIDGARPLAQALFQLLVPMDLQPMLVGSGELQIEVTPGTAGIPWELLRPPDDGQIPWAIRSKLLRRLKTSDFRRVVVDTDGDHGLLVIAEPECPKGYPALLQARREGIDVHDLLHARFPQQTQILGADDAPRPNVETVLTRLFERPWRVVHIAGHGIPAGLTRDGKKHGAGVVLSEGVLSASEIRAMRTVPELVFLNCCHIGDVGGDRVLTADDYDRSAFAASVAQELIEIGVRCVIAAGWAVNDRLAATFARQFYGQLLEGQRFIDAVHHARFVTYGTAPDQSTWAAYQCYGDPDWRLRGARPARSAGDAPDDDYLASIDDLLVALDALAIAAHRDGARGEQDHRPRLTRLEEIAAKEGWADAPAVQERFAHAWKALRDLDAALRWYGLALQHVDGPATFDAAEQYANLLARRAWQRVRDSGRGAVGAARRDIAEAIDRLTRLLTVGETPARRSLVGSAYKRLALVEAQAGRRTASRAALTRARAAYAEASRQQDTFAAGLNLLAVELALGRHDEARARACEARIKASHAAAPNFWTFVAAHDLALIRSARQGFANAAAILDAYEECFAARAGGIEWDSVYDGAEFVLSSAWHPAKAAPAARATLAALEAIVNGRPRPAAGRPPSARRRPRTGARVRSTRRARA